MEYFFEGGGGWGVGGGFFWRLGWVFFSVLFFLCVCGFLGVFGSFFVFVFVLLLFGLFYGGGVVCLHSLSRFFTRCIILCYQVCDLV